MVHGEARDRQLLDDRRIAKWHVERGSVNDEGGRVDVMSVLERVHHRIKRAKQHRWYALSLANIVSPVMMMMMMMMRMWAREGLVAFFFRNGKPRIEKTRKTATPPHLPPPLPPTLYSPVVEIDMQTRTRKVGHVHARKHCNGQLPVVGMCNQMVHEPNHEAAQEHDIEVELTAGRIVVFMLLVVQFPLG